MWPWKGVVKGEEIGETFTMGEAAVRPFFRVCLPELRALAARANIALIFERDGGEVRRQAKVFADDPTRVGGGVATPVVDFTGAGGGMRSVPACVDPGTILTVVEGEGTGEVEVGREIGRAHV